MYAIVQIQGQQFKVEADKTLFVHHLAGAEAGQEVEFEDVLLVDNEGEFFSCILLQIDGNIFHNLLLFR